MDKGLSKLDELFNQVAHVPDFIDLLERRSGHSATYKFKNGSMTSESIYSCKEISIARTALNKGITVDFHKHAAQYEIMIVLSGAITIEFKTNKIIHLRQYGYLVVETEVAHSITATEDTVLISLTVPKDDGFPE